MKNYSFLMLLSLILTLPAHATNKESSEAAQVDESLTHRRVYVYDNDGDVAYSIDKYIPQKGEYIVPHIVRNEDGTTLLETDSGWFIPGSGWKFMFNGIDQVMAKNKMTNEQAAASGKAPLGIKFSFTSVAGSSRNGAAYYNHDRQFQMVPYVRYDAARKAVIYQNTAPDSIDRSEIDCAYVSFPSPTKILIETTGRCGVRNEDVLYTWSWNHSANATSVVFSAK